MGDVGMSEIDAIARLKLIRGTAVRHRPVRQPYAAARTTGAKTFFIKPEQSMPLALLPPQW